MLKNTFINCVKGIQAVWRHAVTAMALVAGCAWCVSGAAQPVCPVTPTANCTFGVGSVANDYWAGSGSPAAGATSVTLGARAAGGAGLTIVAGDVVLLIQMQDADISATNANTYGSGVAANNGSGSTALGSAGQYQFVRAANAVGAAGGALTFTPALGINLRTRTFGVAAATATSRWQAIRIPPCATATVSGVTAPAWNGTTGGVVAFDVLGALTLGGATAIDVRGLGFRGGGGRTLTGSAGTNTDYRTLATANANGSKGEGIAGTPRYTNNATYNAAPNVVDNNATYGEGYQNGSYARGAPGNAGGGGTDGASASNNSENSGGGGGGNHGAGAVGGNSWNSNLPIGGRGGFSYSGSLSFGRVFMGGGGGAGSTNNGTGDNTTYTNPPGLACSSGGACSSGARGGGIVIARAGSMSGAGVIDARGADAYNVQNDGAGGGGAGGSVVLHSYSGGNATVNVAGGNGGNAWRPQPPGVAPGERHGPGGGGGAGFIAFSPSIGFIISPTTTGGISGRTTTADDNYGSSVSSGGFSGFDVPAVPGLQPAAFCPVGVKAVRLFTDNGTAGQVNPGDVLEYTVLYRNGTGSAIPGFNITDTLPAALTYVPGSLAVAASGGAAATANAGYTGLAAANTLLAPAISLPPGGIIRATLRATVVSGASAVCGNITNQANGTTLGLSDNADATQNSNGLPAGTYITQSPAFPINTGSDATGVVDVCPPTITKMVALISDPVNGATNPRAIPGAILEYTILVTNPGVAMTANSVVVTDTLSTNLALCVNATCGAGATPVTITDGPTPLSGLTFPVGTTTFSNTTTPAAFTYTPVADATGCDPNVSTLRVNPTGTFADGTAAGADPNFTLKFRVCIK